MVSILFDCVIDSKYKGIFFERINTTLGFTPKERLNHLHIYDEFQASSLSEDLSQQHPILDPDLYVKIAKSLSVTILVENYLYLQNRIIQLTSFLWKPNTSTTN